MIYIFLHWKSNCVDMKFNITDDHPAEMKKASVAEDFSKMETELKEYAIKQEVFVKELESTYLISL